MRLAPFKVRFKTGDAGGPLPKNEGRSGTSAVAVPANAAFGAPWNGRLALQERVLIDYMKEADA